MDKLLFETIALIKAHGYKVYTTVSPTTYAWYTDGTRVVYFQVSSMDGLDFYACHHPNPKLSSEVYPEAISCVVHLSTLWTSDGINKEFLEDALEYVYPGTIRMTFNDLILDETRSGHSLMEV